MNRKRLTIMIVDDNDMMRTLLRGIVRSGGHEVIGEASNGTTAVEMAERLKPDVVCLDVIMPGKDGLEALTEIKANRPDTTVVMITGNADPDTVQEAIMNGASGFIVKPFNAARILDTLSKFTSKQSVKPRP
jgi:two-component system chemotaxis response regulator CheY